MRFLGLGLSDRVPDAKTIWLFRERMIQAGAIDGLLDKTSAPVRVWADTADRSKANEAFMKKPGFVSKAHRKKAYLRPMPWHIQKLNVGKPVIRSRVEHVFAGQKSQTGLFIRTVDITGATMRIGLANIVYNMRRFLEKLSAGA
ncbi:hypothetical protein GKA01_06210 [Gluconobacter kanchanaburiensis NBRC 103587]|uniref:Transposase DDE domain-containing protein n=1 Tax=Gluconobacter kanchanaburiensis NBRC 103587 TaxID=1307948 RepID=A0A511B4X9_9PROT|nr:transposase [Gluconobacter kanchanaburiensis]MBF0861774.1 transposase [Gluconobacter kanchanaburiensis]GBR67415.1 transposase [Gluconobacter kanchanaburiensis NBRC 103587]GEK95424.1 hypothetical protein GKA01_06210 [Gluconobacter kanchanaburiensis NBRC 103587]